MAANTWTVEDASDVLNDIVEQAGGAALDTINAQNFVSVATATLSSIGADAFMSALSQVLTKTLIRVREYKRKFSGIEVAGSTYGNWVRKINFADTDFEEDPAYNLPADGYSVDQYKIKRPVAVQLNWIGKDNFGDHITVSEAMLDTAFSSYEEFMRFVSGLLTHMNNKFERARENFARATLANYVNSKVQAGNNVIYLLSEYGKYLNAASAFIYAGETGYSDETIHYGDMKYTRDPSNYKAFIQWVFSRLSSYSNKLEEMSTNYAIQISGSEITRFTPKANQRLYMLADDKYAVEMMALADTYHDNYLKVGVSEWLTFWQTPAAPDSIKGKAVYIDTSDGSLEEAADATTVTGVFAAMIDQEAVGYAIDKTRVDATRVNAAGLYYNLWYHEVYRSLNDFTENGIIFIMGYDPHDEPTAPAVGGGDD